MTESINITRPRLSLTQAFDFQCRAQTARRNVVSAWSVYIFIQSNIGLCHILSSKAIKNSDSAVPGYLLICTASSLLLVLLLFMLMTNAAKCYKELASRPLTEAREVILAAETADAKQSSTLA